MLSLEESGGQPMSTVKGYAAQSAASPLDAFRFERREPGPRDVEIDIQFCGVCHSDLHTVRNEWMFTAYPVVPGHEIVGRVSRVGGSVTRFKAGDLAGVGCMVDSCRTCPDCQAGLEQYCQTGRDADLQQPGQAPGRDDLRRLFEPHRGGRGVRPEDRAGVEPGRRRAAPVRRDHDLLSSPPLGRHARLEGRHRRPRRPRPHGAEARPRLRRARRPLHDVPGQGGRRPPARRERGRGLEERRTR